MSGIYKPNKNQDGNPWGVDVYKDNADLLEEPNEVFVEYGINQDGKSISTIKGEEGYTANTALFEVYWEGTKLQGVVRADERFGWADCLVFNEYKQPTVGTASGAFVTLRVWGHIKIEEVEKKTTGGSKLFQSFLKAMKEGKQVSVQSIAKPLLGGGEFKFDWPSSKSLNGPVWKSSNTIGPVGADTKTIKHKEHIGYVNEDGLFTDLDGKTILLTFCKDDVLEVQHDFPVTGKKKIFKVTTEVVPLSDTTPSSPQPLYQILGSMKGMSIKEVNDYEAALKKYNQSDAGVAKYMVKQLDVKPYQFFTVDDLATLKEAGFRFIEDTFLKQVTFIGKTAPAGSVIGKPYPVVYPNIPPELKKLPFGSWSNKPDPPVDPMLLIPKALVSMMLSKGVPMNTWYDVEKNIKYVTFNHDFIQYGIKKHTTYIIKDDHFG